VSYKIYICLEVFRCLCIWIWHVYWRKIWRMD